MRNSRKELNDIRFEFSPDRDTANGIATELVQAGLVDGKDLTVVGDNLDKLVNGPKTQTIVKSVVFQLKQHDPESTEVLDEKTLSGVAQLSISD
jgi:serine/threonine-protein kinase OSR1/STK39